MNKIYFLKNPENLKIKVPENSILIYHKDYNIPNIEGIKNYLFEEYRKLYINIETECIIFVGLNKIITPQNRCNFVFDYLTTANPNLLKISIDTSPFIGEPWRLFFHYLFTNTQKFNVPHSYALETEWKKWFYREHNDCRLSSNNIKMFIPETFSDLEKINFEFDFRECHPVEKMEYDKIKNIVFEKYHSPKLIINNLLKETNNFFNLKISFNSYLGSSLYDIPDLKIYRFVIEENKRRMEIYNKVINNESV